MSTRIFLCMALLLGALQVKGDVLTATDADFDDVIKKGEIALVKFYAPWCGHCQKLAPEWEKAEKEVPADVVMVDVDCTKEKEVAKKYNIQGYPTIILFRKGEQVEVYSGARQSQDIVKYLTGNVGPAVSFLSSAEEVAKIKEEHDIVCISVTSDAASTLSKTVETCAQKLRSKMKFVVLTDPKLFPEQKPESIVVYRKNDGGEAEEYTGKVEVEDVEAFLQTSILSFAGEISPANYQIYAESKKPSVWVFLKLSEESSTQLQSQLKELGKKLRQWVVVLWVNAEKYDGVMKHLGLPDDAKTPAFAIAHGSKHFVPESKDPATVQSIESYVMDYSQGKISASVKSQPIPEEETVNGLTTIVGKTLDKYLSSGKDMMIEFYAPWCGHCKKLEPIYAKVAKEFESSDVIIAAMDATENDVTHPDLKVSGFPTLYFIPHGQKPVSFEGDRTFYELYKFVREHASAFKGQPVPPPESKDAQTESGDSKTADEVSNNDEKADL